MRRNRSAVLHLRVRSIPPSPNQAIALVPDLPAFADPREWLDFAQSIAEGSAKRLCGRASHWCPAAIVLGGLSLPTIAAGTRPQALRSRL